MARGRLISRSLGSSQKYHALLRAGGKIGEFCQVLFPLIVANTDDFGRLPGDAFTIKNAVLPTSPRLERVFDLALDVITAVGLIERYEVEGKVYIQVNQFDEHQINLTKRTKSRFPEVQDGSLKFRSNLTESNLTEFNSSEPRLDRRAAHTLFELFWAAYPKKKARQDAKRAWDKRRPDHLLLDAMLIALKEQIDSEEWQKDGGRFVPYPATWLNGARWTDVVEIAIVPDDLDPARYEWHCDHDPHCGNRAACAVIAMRKPA